MIYIQKINKKNNVIFSYESIFEIYIYMHNNNNDKDIKKYHHNINPNRNCIKYDTHHFNDSYCFLSSSFNPLRLLIHE